MMIDWKKDMRDTMWAMFWLGQSCGKENLEADREALKENVCRMMRMATQKTAGQRRSKDHIDWNCLEHTMLAICCAATSLCLAGEMGEMPEMIEGDPE